MNIAIAKGIGWGMKIFIDIIVGVSKMKLCMWEFICGNFTSDSPPTNKSGRSYFTHNVWPNVSLSTRYGVHLRPGSIISWNSLEALYAVCGHVFHIHKNHGGVIPTGTIVPSPVRLIFGQLIVAEWYNYFILLPLCRQITGSHGFANVSCVVYCLFSSRCVCVCVCVGGWVGERGGAILNANTFSYLSKNVTCRVCIIRVHRILESMTVFFLKQLSQYHCCRCPGMRRYVISNDAKENAVRTSPFLPR